MYELEEIEYNKAIEFPVYSESWLAGSSAKTDIYSDFVQKRRVDLQVSGLWLHAFSGLSSN